MSSVANAGGLTAKITKQASYVRQLEKDGASSKDIASAVAELQKLKILAEEFKSDNGTDEKFNRKAFNDLVVCKMFIVPSFEIHGGVKPQGQHGGYLA
mmetsp:Transcript_18881/g.23413  ORF Transcript_18881/g.23413 Transcript_18881/m.23413 type:complete len:98 (-) Transcript_18881:316-609(-)